MKKWYDRLSFRQLSIQQRLPLLICILLLGVVITFSSMSYFSIKKSALKAGHERLQSLTDQLSTMFSQSAHTMALTMQATAGQVSIRDFLIEGTAESRSTALELLQKLQPDSTWVLVELLDSNRKPVLKYGRKSNSPLGFDAVLSSYTPVDSITIRKMYLIGDSIYYPAEVPVKENGKVIGYIARWKKANASAKAVDMLSQLMGANAKLYIGNRDGSLWTNLIHIVSIPKIDTGQINDFYVTAGADKKRIFAMAKTIPNTQWLIVVGFPRQLVLATANQYMRRVMIIGVILIVGGIFVAWLMSRNITRPLKKLTEAASAMTKGDRSSLVEVHRKDELGTLAQSFNSMVIQVNKAQGDLEKKVSERTQQLETVNNELEAFAYSISHDLRAPLRGIVGFTAILEEDYSSKLDDEARRITGVIKNNALKMGHLIDDLLTFSRVSRQDIAKSNINTRQLVNDVIQEVIALDHTENVEWVIRLLPDSQGEINTIRQVWVNLISNAIKFSGKKEHRRIEIGSSICENQTVYFIKDNGVGFDEKYKNKLFKVFQRLHSQDDFEGTGVGLALVEKIISKHGGKVWAEGEINGGASFYFSMPSENGVHS